MVLLSVCFSTRPSGTPDFLTSHGCGGAAGNSAKLRQLNLLVLGGHIGLRLSGSNCAVAARCSDSGPLNIIVSFGDMRYSNREPLGNFLVKYQTSELGI